MEGLQRVHVAVPSATANLPFEHVSQLACPADDENVPTLQSAQSSRLSCFVELVASSSRALPFSHAAQLADPVATATRPDPQVEHGWSNPFTSSALNVPLGLDRVVVRGWNEVVWVGGWVGRGRCGMRPMPTIRYTLTWLGRDTTQARKRGAGSTLRRT